MSKATTTPVCFEAEAIRNAREYAADAARRVKEKDKQIEAQAAEITRLRAELATARREGMKEAAKIAEDEPELPGQMPSEFEKYSRETLARAACIATKRGIVAAIRAAAGEGK